MDFAQDYESAISKCQPMERQERSEDNIYMLYTGGTTGMPKGVMYQHGGHLKGMLKSPQVPGDSFPVQEKIDVDSVALEVKKLADEGRSTCQYLPAVP